MNDRRCLGDVSWIAFVGSVQFLGYSLIALRGWSILLEKKSIVDPIYDLAQRQS